MQLAYDQLAALVAVLREGSFDRAARALHVTPSAVSQRIKQLEQHMGGIVVVRGTPCTPTDLGRTLYRHALQVELLERDLLPVLAPARAAAAPANPIAVAVNADSLATWLMPALGRFVERVGGRIEVIVDDQDHTAAWLRSGRVLGAVTAEARPVQGCRVRALGVMRYRATASPTFVRRWCPDGATARALRAAPVVIFNRKDVLHDRFLRQLGGRTGATHTQIVPSPHALVAATRLGIGWAMNSEALVEGPLAGKRLVDLTPGKWLDVPLYWQQWGLASRTLDALATALDEQARRALRTP